MLPTALMSHAAPGRTRIRISSCKGDRGYFTRTASELKNLRGIQTMEVNPTTGSILLFHDTDIDEIRTFAHEQDLFELAVATKDQAPLADRVAHRLEALDRRIDDSTEGSVDLRSITFAGLVGLSLIQLFRGEILGPTSTLLSDALDILPKIGGRAIHRPARPTNRAA